MVYSSLNVASCVLETFVHFGPDLRSKLPDNFMLVEIEAPDHAGVLRIEREQVPPDAHRQRRDGRTWYQRTGNRWRERGEALVLIAPSAILPQERNAMLNPTHPRMTGVRILSATPFRFDPRLAVTSE